MCGDFFNSKRRASPAAKRGILILALFVGGCGGNPPAVIPTVTQLGKGVIHGRVTLSGTPPPYRLIPLAHGARDETILADENGNLRNVIVYLKDAGRTSFVLPTPVVLDQVDCVYVPHVLAVQAGQTFRIKSSDAVSHNVNVQSSVNPPANYAFSGVGHQDIIFKFAEEPFSVKCDIHPWMKAWIGVFDHPWFAVTPKDGTFTIEGIPPGTYSLAAWQEALPEQEQKVVVNESSPVEANFVFKAP